MNRTAFIRYVGTAMLSILASGTASADWLAVDPGTKISLQFNENDTIILRPVGGTWSHPLCPDVSGAVVLKKYWPSERFASLLQVLTTAAAAGSLVNFNAIEDTCFTNGLPIIHGVKIQAP